MSDDSDDVPIMPKVEVPGVICLKWQYFVFSFFPQTFWGSEIYRVALNCEKNDLVQKKNSLQN